MPRPTPEPPFPLTLPQIIAQCQHLSAADVRSLRFYLAHARVVPEARRGTGSHAWEDAARLVLRAGLVVADIEDTTAGELVLMLRHHANNQGARLRSLLKRSIPNYEELERLGL